MSGRFPAWIWLHPGRNRSTPGRRRRQHQVESNAEPFPGLLPFEEPTDSGLVTLATQLTGAQAETVALYGGAIPSTARS